MKVIKEFIGYPFETAQARFFGFDFFDDPRFAPTPQELATFPNIPAEILSYYNDKNDAQSKLDAYYYTVNNAFLEKQSEILLKQSFICYHITSGLFDQDPGPALPYLKEIDEYPVGWNYGDPLYTEPTFTYYNVLRKGPMALINVPQSPKRLGFYKSTFKEQVATKEDLPLEGNELGDCRSVITDENGYPSLYVWDGSQWGQDDLYYGDQLTTFYFKRLNYIEQLTDLSYTCKPFVWAAEYLPGYRLSKNTTFPSDFIPMFDIVDYVNSYIIGENESISLTTGNIEDMAAVFRATADAFIKAVYQYYLSSYVFITLEYRKSIKESFNEFMSKMRAVCYIPEDYDFTGNAQVSNGPYWDAMVAGDKDLTYRLRPGYVSNLKAAMAAVKKLIEYSSGASIIYTMK